MRAIFNIIHINGRLMAATLGICAALPIASVHAQDISVPIDEAKLVHLDQPATEVIIGNPSIADISVQNGQMLVVTGKSFGVTNLIVLDAQGKEVLNRNVRVSTSKVQTVRLHKGINRFSYDCATRCEATLVPGDNAEYYSNLTKEIREKMGVAQSVIEGDPTGGQ